MQQQREVAVLLLCCCVAVAVAVSFGKWTIDKQEWVTLMIFIKVK
jgi:hypothetical protein